MKHFIRAVKGVLLLVLCMSFALLTSAGINKLFCVLAAAVVTFIFIRMVIKPAEIQNDNRRLKTIFFARELLIVYAWSIAIELPFLITMAVIADIPFAGKIIYITVRFLSGAVIVITSVTRLILSSARLGIVTRLVLFLMWWIPIVNIFIIIKACGIAGKEYELETQRNELFEIRKESEICKTKYPILMVHGVFFRDMKYLNYWGRIPRELIRNGAEIYYGNQQSAAGVEDSARELAERIKQIVNETGCEKVNIIAHSKGGLDARYAVSLLGADKYTASLTTICTPHRGCAFADHLLKRSSYALKYFVAQKYNDTLIKLGDVKPDFLAAVADLTQESCRLLNSTVPDKEGVLYQSVGSRMWNSRSASFPLNFTYKLAAKFSPLDNDGLVDVESMKWGESFKFIDPKTDRGISHGDMIDLFREDIPQFDVREEYVQIVSGLKARGL